jgi:hypothetical protein
MSLSSHFLLSKYAKTNWKRIKNTQQCSGPTFILLLLLAIFELFVLYALKPYVLRDTSPYFFFLVFLNFFSPTVSFVQV